MTLQPIERDNGESFVGDFKTIVRKAETDRDQIPGDGDHRFRHSFELYQAGARTNVAPQSFILIIESHDLRRGSFRDGNEFRDLASLKQAATDYDPLSRFPAETRLLPEAEGIRARYQRRLQRFLDLVAVQMR